MTQTSKLSAKIALAIVTAGLWYASMTYSMAAAHDVHAEIEAPICATGRNCR